MGRILFVVVVGLLLGDRFVVCLCLVSGLFVIGFWVLFGGCCGRFW